MEPESRKILDAISINLKQRINKKLAMPIVKKFDGEFPKTYFNDFLEYIDISEDEFFKKIDELRSPHLWKKIKNQWSLKQQID